MTVQGGRTSLVAGTVPEHDDVLLSTERLRDIGEVDVVERRVHVGAGATLAEVQRAAAAAGLVFGVDLAARDSATVGGMASTNAGGLRTVRYGNMGEQVIGLDVALPDGSVVHRHSQVRSDNTGYDLASLFVGAEGTLGVITGLDLRLHPTPRRPRHGDLRVRRPGRADRRRPGVPRHGGHRRAGADRRAGQCADRRARRCRPRRSEGAWQLLIELAGETDLTDRLADALEDADLADEPAVGVDAAAQQRLWQVREAVAEVLGRLRPAAEIRCVTAAFGDPRVRRRIGGPDRRACAGRDPGAVRTHRRGQPASEHRALRRSPATASASSTRR